MQANTINLTLPYPPSANRYWRSVVNKKTGRAMVFVSEEAKQFKRDVRTLVHRAIKDTLIVGEISLTARFFRPQRSGDLSNRIKVLEDAMQGVVYADDKQIVEIHASRHEDKQNPRVEVEITALGLC